MCLTFSRKQIILPLLCQSVPSAFYNISLVTSVCAGKLLPFTLPYRKSSGESIL